MAYQALYRQWRPKDFSHMVGQEEIMETLRHQVETGRIPHAYLFCGSRGTGKTSTAKILARAINCEHPRNGDPCGECAVCRQLGGEESLDIIEMDAASNRGIDDARNLRESVKYPPQSGRYKVYIVDEVHMLTKEAFNALLKTLEEPPAHIVFILATTEPQQLPATILSRCQRFDFGRIPAAKIAGRLREAADAAGAEATDGALMAVAKAAAGGMRDALSILDMCIGYGRKVDEALVQSVLGTTDSAFLFRFSDALTDEDAAGVLRLIDRLMRDGKEPAAFARSFSEHLRAILTAKCCGKETAEILDLTDAAAEDYFRAGEKISSSRLMNMLDIFMSLESEMKYLYSPRTALENAGLKCCLRTAETDTLALNDRIAELENEISGLKDRLDGQIVVKAAEKKPEKSAGKEKTEPAATGAGPSAETGNRARAALTPTGRSAEDVWKEALKRLQKTEPAIHGMMQMGQFQGFDGSVYSWKANPGFEIIVQSLNSRDRREKIEAELTAASGVQSAFKALDRIQEKRDQETASDEEYVREMRETFGAKSVSVVDRLPDEK